MTPRRFTRIEFVVVETRAADTGETNDQQDFAGGLQRYHRPLEESTEIQEVIDQ